MTDDESERFLADLDKDLEVHFGPDLEKAWVMFDLSEPAPEGRGILREPSCFELDTMVDRYMSHDPEGLGTTELDDQDSPYNPEALNTRLKSALRRLVTMGLATSLVGLYVQWVYLLDDAKAFHFQLGNTWPAILFGGMFLALYTDLFVCWLGWEVSILLQLRRHSPLYSRWQARRQK